MFVCLPAVVRKEEKACQGPQHRCAKHDKIEAGHITGYLARIIDSSSASSVRLLLVASGLTSGVKIVLKNIF